MNKYKFLRSGLKSDNGNETWKIGQWKHIKEDLNICNVGLHCSRYPDQAFSYVQGEVLAIVQIKGKSIVQGDKECWSDMKIVKAYEWTQKDSVALAIYVAELVIDIYEKKYPNDDRPRKAIEAAKKWLRKPSAAAAYAAHAAAYAAYAAHAAYAADAAAHAAYAAAYAADAAAHAADAAHAAYAADAAAHAAYAADEKKQIVQKIREWMIKRIKKLKVYKN